MFIIMRRVRYEGQPLNSPFAWSHWLPSSSGASYYADDAYHTARAARLEALANKRDGEGTWEYRAFRLTQL